MENKTELTYDQAKKMYTETLKVLYKYKGVSVFDVSDLELKSKLHLIGIELKEIYGLNVDCKNIRSFEWNKFGEYKTIAWWGDKYKRTISWPVDGRQPTDELLFSLKFPTGSYIFGDSFNDDYPVDFFKQFWLELKSFNPDYIDEVNHALYWKIENAKIIFNSFEDIINKYHKLNHEDVKQRRIKKMEEELAKLKNI